MYGSSRTKMGSSRTKMWLFCSKLNAVLWLRSFFFFLMEITEFHCIYLCELQCCVFLFFSWKQLQSTSIFLSFSGKWIWYKLYFVLSNVITGVIFFFNIVECCCLGCTFRLWQLKNKIVQQCFFSKFTDTSWQLYFQMAVNNVSSCCI